MAAVEAGGERRPEGAVAEEGSGLKEGAEKLSCLSHHSVGSPDEIINQTS